MKKIVFGLIWFLSTALFGQKEIEVEINKNVEFVTLCYWLIDIGERYDTKQSFINWDNQNFQIKAYEKFKQFKSDPLLNSLKKADENEGLDAYVYLFSQLKYFPNCKLKRGLDKQWLLEYNDSIKTAEAQEFTKEIIKNLNSFYQKINFEKFWISNTRNYDKVIEEIRTNLPKDNFLSKMEEFYQQDIFKEYKLIPSLMIPSGWGFGPTIDSVAFNFFGSFSGMKKDYTSFGFDDKSELTELAVHEYGHSFVNHLVDKLTNAEYLSESKLLFEPIKNSMSKQGYKTWKVCLYEHFVRAGEIIIADNLGDIELAKELKQRYITERDFVYLPIILKSLNYYNKNRAKLNFRDTMKCALEELKSL